MDRNPLFKVGGNYTPQDIERRSRGYETTKVIAIAGTKDGEHSLKITASAALGAAMTYERTFCTEEEILAYVHTIGLTEVKIHWPTEYLDLDVHSLSRQQLLHHFRDLLERVAARSGSSSLFRSSPSTFERGQIRRVLAKFPGSELVVYCSLESYLVLTIHSPDDTTATLKVEGTHDAATAIAQLLGLKHTRTDKEVWKGKIKGSPSDPVQAAQPPTRPPLRPMLPMGKQTVEVPAKERRLKAVGE